VDPQRPDDQGGTPLLQAVLPVVQSGGVVLVRLPPLACRSSTIFYFLLFIFIFYFISIFNLNLFEH